VVPMWLPEGYELADFFLRSLPSKTRIHSRFNDGESELILYIDVYNADVSRKYQWDENDMDFYELGGVVHQILKNYDLTSVVWSRDDVECYLSIDCQEEILHSILKSIYTTEVTE